MKTILLLCSIFAAICAPLGAAAEEIPEETVHNLVAVESVAPGESTPGTIEYYKCLDCDKIFADEEGLYEIAAAEQIYDDFTPDIINYTALEWTVQSEVPITFTTNVCSYWLEAVKIDNYILPAGDYILDEENPDISLTINPRAFAQLDEGPHRLYIDTARGTMQIDFMVVPAGEPAGEEESLPPDIGQIVLIVSLSMLAAICIILTIMHIVTKRRIERK